MNPDTDPRARGVFRERSGWRRRFNAWRKRTPLNPYWIEAVWLRRSMEGLAPAAGGLLLDVGCAERPYEALFTPHVARYVGLEYPPVAHNLIPEIFEHLERLRGVVDLWGDGQRLPVAAGAVDTVLASEVLEHVPRPDDLAAEVARVLKPGGRFLFTVPFAAPLHQMPFDFQRFTPGGIEALLERHGFEVERLEPRGNFAAVAGSLTTQYLLRALAAREELHDGSVVLSRWRAPLVLPLLAVVQSLFHLASKLSRDTSYALGYTVVARRP